MASFTKRNGRLSTSRTYAANFEIMAQARLCCTLMFGPGQSLLRAARWWLASALVIVAILALPFAAPADDRTNLPLKNWGGIYLNRNTIYDDIERLLTARPTNRTPLKPNPLILVDAVHLSTNPHSP